MAENKRYVALLGDIGGTNIRYELVEIDLSANTPTKVLKKANLNVTEHDTIQHSIQAFLQNVQSYPETAVVGIAGPVFNNSVSLANVQKWGLIKGEELGLIVKIKNFRFINDFQAASYGVLLVPKDNFASINGLQIDEKKTRGIIGPGTGLGNSILYNATVKKESQVIILPCEAGHTDFPEIDSQVHEYFEFFKIKGGYNYISLQRGFCGPSFPTMFKFFSEKFPEDPESKLQNLTPQNIITRSLEEKPARIFESILKLILKIYGSAIGNFIAHHLCVGGLYLVGNITNSLIPKLKQSDCLQGFKSRHPEIISLLNQVPISVCKQIDLGLIGAYYVAKQIIQNES